MALPADFQTCRVRGHWVTLLGTIATGSVVFQASPRRIVSAGTTTIVLPDPIVVPLDDGGSIDVHLPATDDPDISPQGFTYRVTERVAGTGRSANYSYDIQAPHDGDIDLSTVVATNPGTGATITKGDRGDPGPSGPPGSANAGPLSERPPADTVGNGYTWTDIDSGARSFAHNGTWIDDTVSAAATVFDASSTDLESDDVQGALVEVARRTEPTGRLRRLRGIVEVVDDFNVVTSTGHPLVAADSTDSGGETVGDTRAWVNLTGTATCSPGQLLGSDISNSVAHVNVVDDGDRFSTRLTPMFLSQPIAEMSARVSLPAGGVTNSTATHVGMFLDYSGSIVQGAFLTFRTADAAAADVDATFSNGLAAPVVTALDPVPAFSTYEVGIRWNSSDLIEYLIDGVVVHTHPNPDYTGSFVAVAPSIVVEKTAGSTYRQAAIDYLAVVAERGG